MLPNSSNAAPTRRAALGIDVLSMRPVPEPVFKLPPQGIAMLRPQHTFVSPSNSAMSLTQGQTNPSAEDSASIAAQHLQGRQHPKHHQHQRHKSAQAVGAAGKAKKQDAPIQEAPVLRRRSSFRKPVKAGEVQHLKSSGMAHSHSSALQDADRLQHDQDQSVSSSGNSLVHQLMSLSWHHSSRVVPEIAPDMFAKGERPVHRPSADLGHLANRDLASTLQRSIRIKRAVVKETRKRSKLTMRDMLRQSVAQVKACILQLQAQKHEQSSMQQALQAMNAQTAAMLDDAIAAVVHEQMHHNPD